MTAADYALLVVVDNDDNRYTLTRRLAREGYTASPPPPTAGRRWPCSRSAASIWCCSTS
jgi:CheY-like chemotaxis protein